MKKILYVGLLIAAIAGTTPFAYAAIPFLADCHNTQKQGDSCSCVPNPLKPSELAPGHCTNVLGKQMCVCDNPDGACKKEGDICEGCENPQYRGQSWGFCQRDMFTSLFCDCRVDPFNCKNRTDQVCKCNDGRVGKCAPSADGMGYCDCRSDEEKACFDLLNNGKCKELKKKGCDKISDFATIGAYQMICTPELIEKQNEIDCEQLFLYRNCKALKEEGCEKYYENNTVYRQDCLGLSIEKQHEIDCEKLFLYRDCKALKEKGCEKYYENNAVYQQDCLGKAAPTITQEQCEQIAKNNGCRGIYQVGECLNNLDKYTRLQQWWSKYCTNFNPSGGIDPVTNWP